MNILTAVSQLRAASALFAEAGLDLEAMLALGDKTALKAHLATITPAAPAITAEHPEVAALITAAVNAKAAELEAAAAPYRAQATMLAAGLSQAGISWKAADAEKGLQAADITAAITARASILAQEQLARRGLDRFPDSTPAADPLNPQAGPKTMTREAFNALTPAEKMKFSAAGGRLIEA